VVLVHPQNGFNGLILNWCIGGCWFTPALTLNPQLLPFKPDTLTTLVKICSNFRSVIRGKLTQFFLCCLKKQGASKNTESWQGLTGIPFLETSCFFSL
jgi:hypothetical protein